MSISLMKTVFDSNLPPTERFVCLCYADHANDEGEHVYPSVSTTAKKTGYTPRTVQRATRNLEEWGILIPLGESKKRTNEYRIDPARLASGTIYHPDTRSPRHTITHDPDTRSPMTLTHDHPIHHSLTITSEPSIIPSPCQGDGEQPPTNSEKNGERPLQLGIPGIPPQPGQKKDLTIRKTEGEKRPRKPNKYYAVYEGLLKLNPGLAKKNVSIPLATIKRVMEGDGEGKQPVSADDILNFAKIKAQEFKNKKTTYSVSLYMIENNIYGWIKNGRPGLQQLLQSAGEEGWVEQIFGPQNPDEDDEEIWKREIMERIRQEEMG